MKNISIPLCLASILLLAACGEKQATTEELPQVYEADENSILLFTHLPPESFDGTPAPIQLRGVYPRHVAASDARSPGTGRVFYPQSSAKP